MSDPPPRLGKIQLQIMQILWDKGEATARQITDELAKRCTGTALAHSTVQTLLRKMEAKGAVAHDETERTFVFRPLTQQTAVNCSVAHDILDRVFGGSLYELVSHLVSEEGIPPEELARLRELLDQHEPKNRK